MSARTIAGAAALALLGLCQCSLLFDLDGLDRGGPLGGVTDSSADATTGDDATQDGEGSASGDDGAADSDAITGDDIALGDGTSDGGDGADVTGVPDAGGDGNDGLADSASDGLFLDAKDAASIDGAHDASDAGLPDAPSADALSCTNDVLKPIPVGAPTVAFSSYRTPNQASFAADGNFTTRWESSQQADEPPGVALPPQWIYLDFGARVFVNRVRISWQNACAKVYEFDVSDDAMNWTLVRGGQVPTNTTGTTNAPTDWSTANDSQGLSGVGRYLRVYMTTRCQPMYGYSLWEMQAFGHPVAGCDGGP